MEKTENTPAAIAASEVVVAAALAAQATAMTADERTTRSLADALREVFGEHTSTQRFVDVSRIPLICSNINSIHTSLEKISNAMEKNNEEDAKRYVNQDQFAPVRAIALGFASLILVAVVGALLALVINK